MPYISAFSHRVQDDQKCVHIFITWVSANRFHRSKPCFEVHQMPFKMRYKAMHNFDSVKFYELNPLYYHVDFIGWHETLNILFISKLARLTENCRFTDMVEDRGTRNRKKSLETTIQ